MIQFTAQEKRLMNKLGDGKPHSATELIETCLYDNLSGKGSLFVTICNIRKKIKPYGQYIHCLPKDTNGETHFVHLFSRDAQYRVVS